MFDGWWFVCGQWGEGGRADLSRRVAGWHPTALGLFSGVFLNLHFTFNYLNIFEQLCKDYEKNQLLGLLRYTSHSF